MKYTWKREEKEEEVKMSKLFINGQSVEPFNLANELYEDDESLSIDAPGHLVVNRKNTETWIGDIFEEEAEHLNSATRMDFDAYVGKKIKIYVQVIGPAKKI